MTRYVLRRLLWVVVVLLAVSVLTFAVFYLLPAGDPALLRAGSQADAVLVEQVRHQLQLDEPWPVQLGEYLRGLVTELDLGYSYQTNTPVGRQILERLPATVSLTLGAAAIWLTSGVMLGIACAITPGGLLDRAVAFGSSVAISIPVYWLGLVSLYVFAKDIGQIKVAAGAGSYVPLTQDPGQWAGSLVLPCLVLATPLAAFYARLGRASMIEALAQEHIRAARAKGLTETVVLRHALRGAMTPIVTAAGLDVGALLGGAVLIEIVFNIPGVGRLAFDALNSADLPMIQGTVFFGAFFLVMTNLVVDILYAWLDPRVRY